MLHVIQIKCEGFACRQILQQLCVWMGLIRASYPYSGLSLGFLSLDCRGFPDDSSNRFDKQLMIQRQRCVVTACHLLLIISWWTSECCGFWVKATVAEHQSFCVCSSCLLRKVKMFFWWGFQTSAPDWTESTFPWCPWAFGRKTTAQMDFQESNNPFPNVQ